MENLFIVLLAAFIVLLILQFVTLLKFRRFAAQLRKIISQMVNVRSHRAGGLIPKQLSSCQFCRHRASYIKMDASGKEDDFYYRCRLHDRQINLTSTCEQFQFDVEK